jgi:hypothetical protein
VTRRQEAEQVKQVFYRGERLGISEPAKFFPANLSESLTCPQSAGDGCSLRGSGTG